VKDATTEARRNSARICVGAKKQNQQPMTGDVLNNMPILKFTLDADSLRSSMQAVANAIMREGLDTAGEGAGLLVLNDAQRAAPVKTGTYRRSLGVTTERSGNARLSIYVGSDLPYSFRLEFGFVGVDSLGRHYNQAAQPHLRPAFDANLDRIIQGIENDIGTAIDAAIG
jgi:hypothetical protein